MTLTIFNSTNILQHSEKRESVVQEHVCGSMGDQTLSPFLSSLSNLSRKMTIPNQYAVQKAYNLIFTFLRYAFTILFTFFDYIYCQFDQEINNSKALSLLEPCRIIIIIYGLKSEYYLPGGTPCHSKLFVFFSL